mgnify:CR=1 FL=1|jgi:hypothetical protein
MNYTARKPLYEEISRLRERPLLAYVTSYRQNGGGNIASDIIPEIIKQINRIPATEENIDLLIMSYGGDPTVSYRIVNILRERFKKFGVLLPFAAYSAATLISLGADEIYMHPFSNLGPVDPQLAYKKNNGNETINFGSEDLRNFIDFVRKDVGVTDQKEMQKSFNLVCKEVGAIPIGIAKRSSQLALSMGEKLLSLHMSDGNKAKTIAETLNKSFYHHGYPLGRTEAKKIGLPIVNPKGDLESLLWQVFESFESEMKFNEPFDPLKIVLNDATSAALLAPAQQIQLPANLPSEILQEVYKQVLQQIKVVQIPPISYEIFNASLESSRCRSEFKTIGKIFANKLPDNNIAVNVLPTSSAWNFCE